MFKTKGGAGGQRLFEQCSKKNCRSGGGWHPLGWLACGQQTSDGRNVNMKLEFCKAEFAIMSKTEPLII